MAEIELSVLSRQSLDRRIGSLGELQEELKAWQKQRNGTQHSLSWRFTTDDARIKLRRLYPSLNT